MNAQFVLDASALLSILLNEGGQDRVLPILDRSRIHAVNLVEVVARLVRSGMPPDRAAAAIQDLYLDIDEEFTPDQAAFCGALLGTRRELGLSLGDCVCLTVAAQSGAIAVTADRRWNDLNGLVFHNATIRVELIR